MKRISVLGLVIALCLELSGCAHPISMAPDLAAVEKLASGPLIDRKVGYYLSDASRATEITTPGGGGDKVRYFPYRDLEAGLYKTLGTVFRDVAKVSSADDAVAIREGGLSLLLKPEISTTSFSDSVVTWPPTLFVVKLTCVVKDAQGKTIDTISTEGSGRAEFTEFKADFSLAAKRASNEALKNLAQALRQSPALAK